MYKPIPFNQVEDIACDMRHDILTMVHTCGKQNGHLGGCMSAVEILAVLYTQVMNINYVAHSNVMWAERDRFIMSKGHAGIAMYAALKHVGLISQEMINGSIRGENTVIYRHPKRNIHYGIECSVGSLGMGLSYGIGLAESFKRRGTKQNVYVLVGDGECDEGSIWESAAYAGHRRLDNVIVIIDKNGLQLDGYTQDVLSMDNMIDRWRAFGFKTIEIDGHNIDEIKNAFDISHDGQPLAIIANTIKGKGMPFAENKVEWHDNYLSDELYEIGINSLGNRDLSHVRSEAKLRNQTININECIYKNEEFFKLKGNYIQIGKDIGLKNLVGEVSFQLAEQDEKFTLIYADCAKRIGIEHLQAKHPEKCYEVGISEQNQIVMAAAMAHEGFHVVAIAYAPFITARVLDQIRANLSYMKAPVCLIGLCAGLASSDLGATHTAFEDISNLRCLPNIIVNTPVDAFEVGKAVEYYVNHPQPMYVRITIGSSNSCIYQANNSYDIFKSDVIQNGSEVVVIATGTAVLDALESMKYLKKSGISPCIINVRTIKPLDEKMVLKIKNYKKIVTVEEHNIIGGLGSAIAETLGQVGYNGRIKMLGINDEYFCADISNNIRKKIGIDAEGIANAVKKFVME